MDLNDAALYQTTIIKPKNNKRKQNSDTLYKNEESKLDQKSGDDQEIPEDPSLED